MDRNQSQPQGQTDNHGDSQSQKRLSAGKIFALVVLIAVVTTVASQVVGRLVSRDGRAPPAGVTIGTTVTTSIALVFMLSNRRRKSR